MAEPDNFDTKDRQHISIDVFRETAAYTFPSRKQVRKPLRGDYAAHAMQLLDQLAAALGTVPTAAVDPRLSIQGLKTGTVVEGHDAAAVGRLAGQGCEGAGGAGIPHPGRCDPAIRA